MEWPHFTIFLKLMKDSAENAREKYPLVTLIILCLTFAIAPALWILAWKI
jgi:hypothetical protein